jgi:CO dehydrogenase/acetyl-CoA synthase gamma subunit (corrinoid Fe-S protein)
MAGEQKNEEFRPLEEEDLLNYLPDVSYSECGAASDVEFAELVIEGKAMPTKCAILDEKIAAAMEKVFKIELPEIGDTAPGRPVTPGVIKIGNPTPDSMVLINGNCHETIAAIKLILEETNVDAFLLAVDSKSYSVDSALKEGTFSPSEVYKSLGESGIANEVKHRKAILPGLCEPLAADIRRLASWDWEVKLGPVSALELPMFLIKMEQEA